YLDGELLYDNQELCMLLNVTKRAFQRYRTTGELPFQALYHKTFYKQYLLPVVCFCSQGRG
ncbi:MAG: helix-turn-helix domain-containing protein, partial [Tannerellaceae bacterium]|nr:helix-turn-helix domain-containing protein [Tannerellaceae bacterium]